MARQFAKKIEGNPLIDYYTYHVGEGAPRFVLSFEPTFNKTNFVEFVIVAKDAVARDQLKVKLTTLINDELPAVQGHTKVIANGPSADYPVMLRVKGDDHDKVREIAKQVEQVMTLIPM